MSDADIDALMELMVGIEEECGGAVGEATGKTPGGASSTDKLTTRKRAATLGAAGVPLSLEVAGTAGVPSKVPSPPLESVQKRTRRTDSPAGVVTEEREVTLCRSPVLDKCYLTAEDGTGFETGVYERLKLYIKMVGAKVRQLRELVVEPQMKKAELVSMVNRLSSSTSGLVRLGEELQTDTPSTVTRPLGREVATQTERRLGAEEIRQKLDAAVGKEALGEVLLRTWPVEVFEKVVEKTGGVDDVAVVAMLMDLSLEANGTSYQEGVLRRAPVVRGLLPKGELTAGQIFCDRRSSGMVGEGDLHEERSVFVFLVDSGEGEVETAWRMVRAIEKIQAECKLQQLVYTAAAGKVGTALKKVLEWYGRTVGREQDVFLVKDSGARERGRTGAVAAKGQGRPEGKPTRTVRVRGTGKNFADILRAVKTGVDVEKVGPVLSLRKGEGEELHIRVTDDGRSGEAIKAEIQAKVEGVTVAFVGKQERRAIVHVKDLDEEATEEDVLEGVKAVVGESVTDMKVSALRPAFGRTRNATVSLADREARVLVAKGRIKVGWVACRVELRQEEQRCYRCWQTGHVAARCSGPDRSQLCFNCGEAGHVRRGCDKPSRCVACGGSGHRLGSKVCLGAASGAVGTGR